MSFSDSPVIFKSLDSSVGIELGYGLDDRGSIQWVPGALSLGVKRPGCEGDHSPPSSAEVKE
jgi:hypothetical protein